MTATPERPFIVNERSGTSPIVEKRSANELPQESPWPQPTTFWTTVECWPVRRSNRAALPVTPRSRAAPAACGAARTAAAATTTNRTPQVAARIRESVLQA